MYPFKNILAATDFGPSSTNAVDLAVSLALSYDAKLSLVHAYAAIVPIYPVAVAPPIESLRDAAQAAMEGAIGKLRERVPGIDGFVRHGDAWSEILEQAKDLGSDLVVIGTHGHRGVSRFFLGSVAEKVVRSSPVPVLTVRSPHAHT
ncbi:MAG: universal stress protein [Polyangiaceae bacterium]|nr:universal stress protein [Polyangiaceae bacterium]